MSNLTNPFGDLVPVPRTDSPIDDEIMDKLLGAIDQATDRVQIAQENQGPSPDTMFYIHSLESQTGKKLGESQYLLFKDLTNKKDINKLFFGLESTYLDEQRDVKVENLQLIQKTLAQTMKRKRAEAIKEYERTIYRGLEDAKVHYGHAQNSLVNANASRLALEELLNKEPEPVSLEKLQQNKFWRIQKVDASNNKVLFLSQPVILRYKREAQGIDYCVNMGRYMLHWTMGRADVRIYGDEGTADVQGTTHPHIMNSGTVCWGSAGSTISKALVHQDIYTILDVAQAILHVYNPDSPYTRLEEFFAVKHPELLQGETEYRPYQKAWIEAYEYNNNLAYSPEIIEESGSEDDDDLMYLVQIYAEYNKKYGVAIPDKFYIKSKNNRYAIIEEGQINDWY